MKTKYIFLLVNQNITVLVKIRLSKYLKLKSQTKKKEKNLRKF